MKKILCLILAVLWVFTLSACNGEQPEAPAATEPEVKQRSNVVETDENGQTNYLLADFETTMRLPSWDCLQISAR